MRYSVSRVSCFKMCPYQYRLRYIDETGTLPDYDDPQNALYLGSALHKGIETTPEEGIRQYYNSYPVISDAHVNEAIKLDYWIKKVKEILPEKREHEVEVTFFGCAWDFIGFLDLVSKNEDGTYDLFDFKYSNNIDKYLESAQLHVYKYFFERVAKKKIRKIFFIFVPKVLIRQKKTETVQTFRIRLMQELEKKSVQIKEIPYDEQKVTDFYSDIGNIEICTEFTKNETRLCDWCEYKQFCKEGIDYMMLPSSNRRSLEDVKKTRLWIYGAPFSGKTTLADQFPVPLMLNTDGNADRVTAPYVTLKDVVEVDGRITKTTLAWELFKMTIAELKKKQNDFQTIVLDLVEDMYESCRIYMYKQMGITHESDDSFRAWDKVRTEFLSTMRDFMNLDYENIILISHEDTTKDITKRTGDKITSVRPNIAEKIANKLAGMVHLVVRAVVIDGKYLLSLKPDEVVFGGGRIKVDVDMIDNNFDKLGEIISIHPTKEAAPKKKPYTKPVIEESPAETAPETSAENKLPKKDEIESAAVTEEKPAEEAPAAAEEKPKRRTRRTRA